MATAMKETTAALQIGRDLQYGKALYTVRGRQEKNPNPTRN